MLSPFSAAKRATVATSPALSTIATAAGRWSASRFQAERASSQSASPGVAILPSIASALKSVNSTPFPEFRVIHRASPAQHEVGDHIRWKEAVGGDPGIGLEAGGEGRRIPDLASVVGDYAVVRA